MPVVSAHGIAVHSEIPGAAVRLETAMRDAILQANSEGISNDEKDAPIMRRRMRMAYLEEFIKIGREQFEQQMETLTREFEQKIRELSRAHNEHRGNLYGGWREQQDTLSEELAELRSRS